MIRFLIVESDPMLLDALLNGVGVDTDGLVIDTAPGADEALEKLSDFDTTYEVLIVGTGLGARAGDLCQRARALSSKLHILQIIRGYSEVDHREALSHGASDVVSADRLPTGLEMRLQPIRHALALSRELHEQLGYAQRTAFSAMSSMGELGIVLEFLRKSFLCTEPLALANQMMDAVEKYDLKGIVRIAIQDSIHVYSRAGVDQEAETKIMGHALTMGRIFEFRDRGAYNYGKASLVVMGMPREDVERCGRLRDNLALLAEAADAKAQAIEIDHLSRQRARAIQAAQKGLFLNLKMARANQKRADADATGIVLQFQSTMDDILMRLALTPNQETTILSAVSDYSERLTQSHGQNDDLIGNLQQIADLMNDTDGAIGS